MNSPIDHQFIDALVGLAKALVGFAHHFAHLFICFLELFGDPVETFSSLSCQFGDQLL
jgi:hypothetical protein